jgi:UDP-N-acetylmuramoyl-L-alanyl-D-glutamate--2,6-diaminopimelate ligase
VASDVVVNDLTLDSRQVVPGSLFLACKGRTHHGLKFVGEALARGVRAVLYESAPGVETLLPPAMPGVVFAAVPELTRSVGLLASRFFGAPSETLHVAGITGTSGKTTCAWLLAQALTHCGRPAAYLGTLGFGTPPHLTPMEHTTPDAVSLHRLLDAARRAGASSASMEVSSHALDQDRVAGVRFETAAFTNLTRDHLDYHGTMEAYGAAKARLLTADTLKARVINIDDPFGARLASQALGGPSPALIVTTRGAGIQAFQGAQWVRATAVSPVPAGLVIEIDSSWGSTALKAGLIGAFNVENVLTVLALLIASDIPLGQAVTALEHSSAASGRMELLGGGERCPLAVVDYSHKPDALAKALKATREHCPGTLRVVFGCGGDRDRGKRPVMGRIAAELADEVTLTDDNPRSENPEAIVAEILEGIAQPSQVRIEHDRERAIRGALERSQPGDAVLIAGKGHENYQIYGSTRRTFSDQAVVLAALGGASESCNAP